MPYAISIAGELIKLKGSTRPELSGVQFIFTARTAISQNWAEHAEQTQPIYNIIDVNFQGFNST